MNIQDFINLGGGTSVPSAEGDVKKPSAVDAYTKAQIDAKIATLNTTISGKQTALGFTPVNKAGDTVNGVLEISMSTPQVKLTSTNTSKSRYLYHDGTNIGFLGSGGSWLMRFDDTGAMWTSQLGDINTRIENRAAAYMNNCVTSSQMAGYIEQQASTGGTYTYGAYVIVMASRRDSDAYAFGFRQPQLYIPNRGWFAAFNF